MTKDEFFPFNVSKENRLAEHRRKLLMRAYNKHIIIKLFY